MVKNALFTHIMCYKADHKQVLCFQKGPLQKLKCAGILLSKGPPNATEICKYSAFKLHCRAPKRNCSV